MRKLSAIGVCALAAMVTTVGHDAPVRADCSSPSVHHERPERTHGGVDFHVWGSAWGDSCYDGGNRPRGVGVLGMPVQDIEVSFAQGERRVVVARGAADENYEFAVTVTIPPDLEPGPVRLIARSASWPKERPSARSPQIIIDDRPPIRRRLDGPAEFGPTARRTRRAPPTTAQVSATATDLRTVAAESQDDDGSARWQWALGGLVVGAGMTAGLSALRRRRSPAPSA